ncbi:hypothetical protein ACFYON_09225 [Micromonospora sp. NPDC005686]|uniref:hypothetical protein n=1 Tax=unclassified Micromonospora TaxID=2617518 RepID=UPI0033B4CF9E
MGVLRDLAPPGRERHLAVATGVDRRLSPGDVLPLVFAAASPATRPAPATRAGGHGTGQDRTGGHYPGRAAGSPYPNGHDPARDGEFRARLWQRPGRASPWPALPDDTGPARTTDPVAAGAGQNDRGTHADPWPALPAEPAWLPERATPWRDTARLDREQAGD